MMVNYNRVLQLIKYGKEVDVSNFTVNQLMILQKLLKSEGIQYSKRYDVRNSRLSLVNYKNLDELVKKNREVMWWNLKTYALVRVCSVLYILPIFVALV